jgi:hypothetical protein
LHKIPISASSTKIYSRDRDIWHISHEGGVLWKLVRSGGVYEHKYLLAKKQIEVALATGCDAVTHFCTGKGLDQVRSECCCDRLGKAIARNSLAHSSSQPPRLSFMPLRPMRSDGGIRPATAAKSPSRLPSFCCSTGRVSAVSFPNGS